MLRTACAAFVFVCSVVRLLCAAEKRNFPLVFIASLQSPFVLCDSRALPRTCFNRLWALARDAFKQRVFSTVLRPLSQVPTLLYHSFPHNHSFLISPQHYQACLLPRTPLSRPSLPLQVRIIASGLITSSPGFS